MCKKTFVIYVIHVFLHYSFGNMLPYNHRVQNFRQMCAWARSTLLGMPCCRKTRIFTLIEAGFDGAPQHMELVFPRQTMFGISSSFACHEEMVPMARISYGFPRYFCWVFSVYLRFATPSFL